MMLIRRERVLVDSEGKHHEVSVTDWPLRKHQKRIARGGLAQPPLRRIDALIRQLERAVVDRDAGLGGQDLVGSNRLLGRHVNRRHEPARLVGSDRQQRQARRSEPLADLREMVAEGRVSREINDAAGGFDHVAAPQSPIAVEDSARGKMHRGDAVDGGSRDRQRIAPIEFVHGTDAVGPQQTGHAKRNDELGLAARAEPAQGGEIQMIVVIVAEEHDIDAGKIFATHPRLAAAARTDPGERTCPLRPDRIGQDVKPALLEQHSGMVDQRDAQRAASTEEGGLDGSTSATKRGGAFRAAGELPSQDVEKAARLRGVGIEEALPVKVRNGNLPAPKLWGECPESLCQPLIYHETRQATRLVHVIYSPVNNR